MNLLQLIYRRCCIHLTRFINRHYRYKNTIPPTIKPVITKLPTTLESSFPDSKVHRAYLGPTETDRTQAGPVLAPLTLLLGLFAIYDAKWFDLYGAY